MRSPILGGAYVARSVNAAANRQINLYAEAVKEGGDTAGFFSRCPGLVLLTTVGNGPIRGLLQSVGYLYAVSGASLYKIDSAWNAALIGTVSGSGPVSMAENGTQIFIACNPDGFIYNTSTGVFAQITDPDFPGAVTVGYLDGYFVFNEPNSQKVWVTSLLDGTAVDPLDFASSEGAPDNLVSLIVDHLEAWLFGANSIEVWYDAGLADFPLARIQGAFIETGCDAVYSVAKLDNSVFWLGGDARGRGVVYRANGYTPARISTEAIELAIQNYTTTSDAIGYTYQQEGHAFYVLSFPTEGKTWVFDVSTNLWHERCGFSNGIFTRHESNCQAAFAGKVVVGSYVNGKLYSLDLNTYADNSSTQKWLRAWRALPPNTNNLKRTAHHSLQIDYEAGVGLNTGQGSNPQVLLRWSDDGGHTWSNYHAAGMGVLGATGKRLIWRRLGMTDKLRDRVYEISGTDPVKIAIKGAEIVISATNA